MSDKLEIIRELRHKRADLEARLKFLGAYGTIDIKTTGNNRFIYIRKRINGKLTSTYVGPYSDELFTLLHRNNQVGKELKRELREVQRQLSDLGYGVDDLSPSVIRNIDYARANLKASIYDQAVLEGVATTFPQTAEIIDNGIVNGVKASDVLKILNLKHAWEFILDKDVISSPTDYYLLCRVAGLVNEGFYYEGGRIRNVNISISGTSYLPPIPDELDVKTEISQIITSGSSVIDITITLCLYCMKKQIFLDGNKRASVLFANHYLISHGQGIIVIPEKEVDEFRSLLINYYESDDMSQISAFLKDSCWRKL